MTKPRAPLTIADALVRIADRLPGRWATMAAITGRHEGLVRRWADDAQRENLPFCCAPALDAAFRRFGGDGAPLLEVFQAQLDLAEAGLDQAEDCPAEAASRIAREAGEAIAAVVDLTQPSADHRHQAAAARQLSQLIAVANDFLGGLSARLAVRRRPP